MQSLIQIHHNDNVAVALRDIQKGEALCNNGVSLLAMEDIPRGHKIALRPMQIGEEVIKYGYPIGRCTEEIPAGTHVHVHNIRTKLEEESEYQYQPIPTNKLQVQENQLPKSFWGYRRKNQKVGIRNELWIVPTVGCVNAIAKQIAANCQQLVGGNIDAVVAFGHPYGCSQMGDDQEHTREALSGLIKHPNAGGVLVLGLGCENSNIEVLKPYLGAYDEERIRFLQCQDEENELEKAMEIMEELAMLSAGDVRSECPVNELIVGLKCGGSDGLSGITANPTVGRFSDLLVGKGGSTILTEVPEMFGAETILMNRAKNAAIYEKVVKLIQDFKAYYRENGQTIYENPSPGNKAGGISTLEDKALGCTQKAGSAMVEDVLDYAMPVTGKGLHLLSAPGNDLVASTALAVSGAQLILFTTGRGTPFASAVPTVKIATNTPLAQKKKHWIDFDCGVLLQDEETAEHLSEELYRYVISVADGKWVKAEQDGYRDLAIFKQGVTL